MRTALAALAAAACVTAARGEDAAEQWSLHGQATYGWQHQPSFEAPYTGPHSLQPEAAYGYSFTTTLFGGARLWRGGEGYANLEGVQGVPFSNMTGLGGFPNGELQKTAGPQLKGYRARLFVRQTFGFGGGTERLDADANQLGGEADRRRLVITAGNFAVSDLFDTNRYSHDPRTDFFNWSLMDSGAYDFAADARGYTWGAAIEWRDLGWAVRAGRFMQPQEPNGLPLDTRILEHHGDQLEFEKPVAIGEHAGIFRVLAFRNVAIMGRYRDALALAQATGATPDLALVRRREAKWGGVLNVEQEVARDLGVFLRASWNDGGTETYAFTEIDRSVALGTAIDGVPWRRPADRLGLAFVSNEISGAHRDYLAAGGLGFFLGDGRLDYRPEQVFEGFYRMALGAHAAITGDVQHIRNPGYNADRGPVLFYGLRVHAEF